MTNIAIKYMSRYKWQLLNCIKVTFGNQNSNIQRQSRVCDITQEYITFHQGNTVLFRWPDLVHFMPMYCNYWKVL